jgi:hypothetical protein
MPDTGIDAWAKRLQRKGREYVPDDVSLRTFGEEHGLDLTLIGTPHFRERLETKLDSVWKTVRNGT